MVSKPQINVLKISNRDQDSACDGKRYTSKLSVWVYQIMRTKIVRKYLSEYTFKIRLRYNLKPKSSKFRLKQYISS